MTDGFPDPGGQEQAEVTVDRLPRRECRGRRQVAPLAPRAHDVEQTVQHAPHIGGPGSPAGLGRGNERLDQAILVVAEGLTGAKVSNPCTIRGRPHRSLQKGEVSPSEQPSTRPFTLAQRRVAALSKRAVIRPRRSVNLAHRRSMAPNARRANTPLEHHTASIKTGYN